MGKEERKTMKYLPEGRNPNLGDLDVAIYNNVVCHTFWKLYTYGDLTFQEALIGMVLALVEQNEHLLDELSKTYWFIKNEYQKES